MLCLFWLFATPRSIHGILQAWLLEWAAIPFSRDLPNQGTEPSRLHYRQILYCLNYQETGVNSNIGGFLGGSFVKNLTPNVGDIRDVGLITGSKSSPTGGNGNPLQYSCLRSPMEEEPGGLLSKGSQEPDPTEWLHNNSSIYPRGGFENSVRVKRLHTELYETLVLVWSCNCVGMCFSTLTVSLLLTVTCFASSPTWGTMQNKQPHPGLGKNQCPGLNWHSVSRLLLNPFAWSQSKMHMATTSSVIYRENYSYQSDLYLPTGKWNNRVL